MSYNKKPDIKSKAESSNACSNYNSYNPTRSLNSRTLTNNAEARKSIAMNKRIMILFIILS